MVALSTGVACSHASGSLMVDSPRLLPYQPPDIDELTGIDSSEDSEDAKGAQGSAGDSSGSAQNPQQTPRK
jgi:hypothetical protein